MADEWYRSPRWAPEDQELFEAKLGRARRANRPQYLRLKGHALAASSDPGARAAAPQLLRRVLSEYPEDKLQGAMALHDLAAWRAGEGDDRAAAALPGLLGGRGRIRQPPHRRGARACGAHRALP